MPSWLDRHDHEMLILNLEHVQRSRNRDAEENLEERFCPPVGDKLSDLHSTEDSKSFAVRRAMRDASGLARSRVDGMRETVEAGHGGGV